MPTKTKKAPSRPAKSNVAKSTSLTKKSKFNWKYVAVIGIVLAALIGFLYVRLSHAASEVPCTGPKMAANCYYMPNQALRSSGGQLLGKTNGTVSWAGSTGNSITFGDKIYADSSGTRNYQYCFYVQFSSAGWTKWRIDWKNTTANTSTSREGIDTQSSGQTVRCVSSNAINGSGLTNQEVKFTVENGGAIVYKFVRDWNGTAVVQNNPGTKITPAPAPAPATGTTTNQCTSQTFSQGSQGSCVTIIQNRLKDLGYGITTVDGVYGSNTTSAVKVFQSRNGLSQDGVVGPQTWTKLIDPNAARKS